MNENQKKFNQFLIRNTVSMGGNSALRALQHFHIQKNSRGNFVKHVWHFEKPVTANQVLKFISYLNDNHNFQVNYDNK